MPEWQESAACKKKTDLFFPTRGSPEQLNAARAICNVCPVFDECKEWALEQPNTVSGFYAGMANRERMRIRKAQGKIKHRERPIGYGWD